jgi:hypothetical protein
VTQPRLAAWTIFELAGSLESLAGDADELEPEQRLHAWQHDACLRQHLRDSFVERVFSVEGITRDSRRCISERSIGRS